MLFLNKMKNLNTSFIGTSFILIYFFLFIFLMWNDCYRNILAVDCIYLRTSASLHNFDKIAGKI